MPDSTAAVSEAAIKAAVQMQSMAFIDDIRGRADFPARARAAVDLWRMPDGDDTILAATLRDMGRFMGAIWAVYLHNTPGGFTLTRLTSLLEDTALSGPGRARAMIAYMQFLGYIAPAPARGDTRLKRYEPTPRMLEAMSKRYILDLRAAAWLAPEADWVIEHFNDPGVADAVMTVQGELMLAFFRTWRPDGVSLNVFSEKFAGMMLLSELVACAEPDDVFPPAGVLRYSTASMARRCGVSRTQIRRMLKAGAEEGFLVLGEEGEAWPTPLLREHLELAAVGQMSSFMHTVRVVHERFAPSA